MTDETTTANEALLDKKGKKGKGKKGAADQVEVVDVIISTSHELENLSREEALSLIPELTNNVDFSYFRLGGVLAVIQGNSDWWKADGFDTFREFIENRFGIQYRKAMYLIGIYGNLVESGVPWEKLSGIGWSKVKEIAPILTVDNVDEWVERANELTVMQLHEAVKKAQLGTLDKTDTTPDTGGVTTFTAKVHPDQKASIDKAIEKAMIEAKTEFKGVALEAICLNYLSGAKVSKPKSLVETFKSLPADTGAEDVLKAFAQVWPDIDLTVTM
ncbi:MAG TPA: hypothetical protein VGD46_15555 [Rhizobacter sp.]